MKIGVDARSLVGNISGVGYYLKNIIKYGGFEENKLFLYFDTETLKNINKKSFISEHKNITFRNIDSNKLVKPTFRKATPIWWVNITLYRSLIKDDIDLFFAPNFVQPILFSKSSILVVHDLIHKTYPQAHKMLYSWYLNLFLTLSIFRTDHIITVSKNTKKDLQKYYNIPSNKISVAYGAASKCYRSRDLSMKKKRDLREKYGLPNKKFLLYVGNIEPRKNLSVLIDALIGLNKKERPPLVIVGKKHLKDKKFEKKYKNYDFKEEICFTGYVSEKDLPFIYNMASIFVYPSLYEGFGLPVLEAMQSGIPVITSNKSSIPEIVGDSGITIDVTDSTILADNIVKLYTNKKLRKKYSEKGKKRAEKFSWTKTGKKINSIINKFS